MAKNIVILLRIFRENFQKKKAKNLFGKNALGAKVFRGGTHSLASKN